MKMLRFIAFLFTHGTWTGKALDFEKRKATILQTQPDVRSKNLYIRLRVMVASGFYTNRLLAVLAYVKNYKKAHRQYFFMNNERLCYLRIFKSASTSMLREVLPRVAKNLNTHHYSDQQIDVLADTYVEDSLKRRTDFIYFTLVRNPFHRIVSVYLDLFDPGNIFFSYQVYFFGILKRGMTFSEFVSAITKIPDSLKSPHFASQYQVIKNTGNMDTIKLFRIEKDKELLSSFLSRYGIALNHSNRQQKSYSYQDYYDLKTVALVYEMYKQDIEKFNYQAEYAALLTSVQRDLENVS
jgi:hypothetical protein